MARELRALGFTVSLKSGMVASSRDFGRLLLNTLAESDVRMGLQDHIRDLGLDAYTGKRPRKRIALRRRTQGSAQSRKGLEAKAHNNAPGRRLFPGGVYPQSMYGVQQFGLSPTAVRTLRRQAARHASVKADVSRHCLPWRWGSMIRRRRLSETCWSSGSTSGSISQRPIAKECTVLGTWRNRALFRLPGGSAGTESRAL